MLQSMESQRVEHDQVTNILFSLTSPHWKANSPLLVVTAMSQTLPNVPEKAKTSLIENWWSQGSSFLRR